MVMEHILMVYNILSYVEAVAINITVQAPTLRTLPSKKSRES